MKNFLLLLLLGCLVSSCDPTAQMTASIQNSTNENLQVDFISSDNALNKFLQVGPDETELFEDVFDVGNTYLEPRLVDYDSVVIRNRNNEVLKVYKPNDSGRSIYNLLYWKSSEPAKRSFVYLFEIQTEDIQ